MSRAVRTGDTEGLAAGLAGLSDLDAQELKARWRLLYATKPPARISRALLVRAIAYRLQEQALGGLKPATQRLLVRALEDATAGRPMAPAPISRLKAGTRLLRTWQGTTHDVTVLDDGVLFRGKRYRSLSEVARMITGARWSGPRFFGLHATKSDPPHGPA